MSYRRKYWCPKCSRYFMSWPGQETPICFGCKTSGLKEQHVARESQRVRPRHGVNVQLPISGEIQLSLDDIPPDVVGDDGSWEWWFDSLPKVPV